MDIKSKKSNSGLAGRLIAFILVAALSASSASAVIFAGANLLHMQEEYVATRVSAADILLDRAYFDSDFFKGRINSDTAHLTQLYSEFGGIDPRDPDYRMESDANAVREFNDTERHIYSEIAEMIEDSMSFYAPEDFDEESINDVVSDAASDSGSSDEAASGEDSQTKTADNSRKNEAIFYQGEPGYEWAMSDNRRISFDIGPMFFDEDLVREKHSNDGYGVNVMFKVSNFDAPGVKKIFEKHYEKNLEDLRAEFVSEKKRRYDEVEKLLDAGGASYYIGGGSGSIANVRLNESGYPADLAVFVSAPAYRTYKDGEMKEHPKTVGYFSDTLPFGYFSDALPSGTSMYISYDKAAVAAATEQLTETKWVRPYFIFAALALALALILLIFLIVVTGRKR
ncbi:MAG: hypothetical protein LBH63_03750, partial [Clostridiales Family XIII bacterium]|nr:hypothetical protein [Clostridiales Family XIII bacterium]